MTDDYEGLANELLQVNEALLQDPAPRLITQLTRGEHFVLNYLLTHHHQAHPVELSRHMVVSTARIAALLGRMEAKGLITRVPAEEGGKRNQISLTERGKQICDEMADYMEEENVKIFDGLTQEDKETAARLFLVITENLAK